MSKPRNAELIRCVYFSWLLGRRNGVWNADGRSNRIDAGRHSLGTRERDEAMRLLPELDRARAEDLGLAPRSSPTVQTALPLLLSDGRTLYEKHIRRPRITGGVARSTAKRHRTVFDKFLTFAVSIGVETWNQVTADVLNQYARSLEIKGYASKTLSNELTTLKQAVRWLIEADHLPGVEPIQLRLRKAESQRPYCYRRAEVEAMIEFCRDHPKLTWLGDVITALACTGLRISELASLRWSDVDLGSGRLTLTDERGRPARGNQQRRELKSGRSRSFPLHPDLVSVLKRLPRDGEYVFRGPRGGRLKPDTVRRNLVDSVLGPLSDRFPTHGGEQGFSDGRLHSFRHYFCSTCANSGVPERVVMAWLGHQDSEMVAHYYHLHD